MLDGRRRHAFTLDRRTALAKPDACQSELWDMEMGAERARFRRGENGRLGHLTQKGCGDNGLQ